MIALASKKPLLAVIAAAALTGCAGNGAKLAQDTPLNQFLSAVSPKDAARTITEMISYCSTGSFDVKTAEYPQLKRLTIDLAVPKSTVVFTRIEIDETIGQQSRVTVYDYFDNAITRAKAAQVELWLNGGSTRCVKGF